MTGAEALRDVVGRLRSAGIDTPERDARRLLAWALGEATARLALSLPETLGTEEAAMFEGAVCARLDRRPVSQITGRRTFWGREFALDHTVLDPRPETETLIALALEAPYQNVLDLGTGTGCILLTLLAERPSSIGTGTDLSAAARATAEGNAVALGLSARAEIRAADWFDGVEGQYDLIVSNPPYIAQSEMAGLAPEVQNWEPRLALTDEGDGLSAYHAIAAGVAAHLVPGGQLLVEVGATQGARVCTLFQAAGLVDVAVHPDLDGRDRVVSAHAARP
ncbi:MAG: peptide chain release factor N(5)-glutamine methyltransferase [Pseudomonadota bacterium]